MDANDLYYDAESKPYYGLKGQRPNKSTSLYDDLGFSQKLLKSQRRQQRQSREIRKKEYL
jgi:hypothetical protein